MSSSPHARSRTMATPPSRPPRSPLGRLRRNREEYEDGTFAHESADESESEYDTPAAFYESEYDTPTASHYLSPADLRETNLFLAELAFDEDEDEEMIRRADEAQAERRNAAVTASILAYTQNFSSGVVPTEDQENRKEVNLPAAASAKGCLQGGHKKAAFGHVSVRRARVRPREPGAIITRAPRDFLGSPRRAFATASATAAADPRAVDPEDERDELEVKRLQDEMALLRQQRRLARARNANHAKGRGVSAH